MCGVFSVRATYRKTTAKNSKPGTTATGKDAKPGNPQPGTTVTRITRNPENPQAKPENPQPDPPETRITRNPDPPQPETRKPDIAFQKHRTTCFLEHDQNLYAFLGIPEKCSGAGYWRIKMTRICGEPTPFRLFYYTIHLLGLAFRFAHHFPHCFEADAFAQSRMS